MNHVHWNKKIRPLDERGPCAQHIFDGLQQRCCTTTGNTRLPTTLALQHLPTPVGHFHIRLCLFFKQNGKTTSGKTWANELLARAARATVEFLLWTPPLFKFERRNGRFPLSCSSFFGSNVHLPAAVLAANKQSQSFDWIGRIMRLARVQLAADTESDKRFFFCERRGKGDGPFEIYALFLKHYTQFSFQTFSSFFDTQNMRKL